jgi:hypothetical protein
MEGSEFKVLSLFQINGENFMKKLVLAVAVLAFSSSSFAACTTKDLTGTWAIHIDKGGDSMSGGIGVAYCTFKIPANGVFKSECESEQTNFGSTTSKVKGTLTVNSACRVQGTITTDKDNMAGGVFQLDEKIDAYISKGKDNMTGRISPVDSMTIGNPANLFLGSKL